MKNCVPCQTLTNEKLVKPQCAGYELLDKNVKEFHKLGQPLYALHESLLDSLNDLKQLYGTNHAILKSIIHNSKCLLCELPSPNTQALITVMKKKM